MTTNTPNLATLSDENQIIRLQKFDATGNTVDLSDRGEAAGGTIAFIDTLEQVFDFFGGIEHWVFTYVEIRGLTTVDLQDAEYPLVPIASDEVKSLTGFVEFEFLERVGGGVVVVVVVVVGIQFRRMHFGGEGEGGGGGGG